MGELGSVVTTLRAEVLAELSDAVVEERFAELHRAHEQLEAEVARSLSTSSVAGSASARGICRARPGTRHAAGPRSAPLAQPWASGARSPRCR
ncbi:MAG: hypothetical protein WD739_09910 [Actinomycetota bacterium]